MTILTAFGRVGRMASAKPAPTVVGVATTAGGTVGNAEGSALFGSASGNPAVPAGNVGDLLVLDAVAMTTVGAPVLYQWNYGALMTAVPNTISTPGSLRRIAFYRVADNTEDASTIGIGVQSSSFQNLTLLVTLLRLRKTDGLPWTIVASNFAYLASGGVGAAVDAPSITPTASGLLICSWGFPVNSDEFITLPSGFTKRSQTHGNDGNTATSPVRMVTGTRPTGPGATGVQTATGFGGDDGAKQKVGASYVVA